MHFQQHVDKQLDPLFEPVRNWIARFMRGYKIVAETASTEQIEVTATSPAKITLYMVIRSTSSGALLARIQLMSNNTTTFDSTLKAAICGNMLSLPNFIPDDVLSLPVEFSLKAGIAPEVKVFVQPHGVMLCPLCRGNIVATLHTNARGLLVRCERNHVSLMCSADDGRGGYGL